jgi:hypothetical protein
MKLSEVAKKPQLVEVSISDERIVEEFGEALTFYTWDRQPMDVFMRLASVDNSNTNSVIEAVRDLILDESGNKILTGDVTLPTHVMLAVITRIVDDLGKF